MQWAEPIINRETLCREKLVSSVDLNAYSGRWHEIAKSKLAWQLWESGCSHVTADYTASMCNGNPELKVVNSCYDDRGNLIIAREAKGTIPYPDYPGAIHLRFLDPDAKPGVGWYFLHDTDYTSYAVVGSPERKFMWILSRSKTICKAKFARLVKMFKEAGYDPRDPEWGLLVNPGTLTECC